METEGDNKTGAAVADATIDAELDQLMTTALSLASAADLTPRTEKGSTSLYGEYRVTNDNTFQKFEELSQVSPHVFIPLAKLGLSIVSGFRLELGQEGGDETTLTEMQDWAQKVDLTNKAQNIARLMVKDGTAVVYLAPEGGAEGVRGIKSLEIQPMRHITLLPEGVKSGDMGTTLLKGEVERAILNEANSPDDTSKETPYERDEFALFRIFHEGYFMKDIKGRETYGIYGMSLLVPVERPIKNMMDLVEGFSGFMRRYGIGRLHIDVKLAAELRTAGKKAEAKQLLEDTIAAMRRIAPNEDIVAYGSDVKPLATGTISGIENMKASLEADIHVGLLQAQLSMGDSKGSTYAAGYISEEDRYLILESIQRIFIETLQREIIDRQLEAMGKEAGAIKVMVDPLDMPYTDPRTLNEMFMNDAITLEELREKTGFPKEKPIPERQPPPKPKEEKPKEEKPKEEME